MADSFGTPKEEQLIDDRIKSVNGSVAVVIPESFKVDFSLGNQFEELLKIQAWIIGAFMA